MADLVESDASFPATTPSIIVTDAVVGAPVAGPFNNGIANGPHVKLADRTQWLKTNKAGLAGGNTFAGKNQFDISSLKYITGTQWNDASNFNFELTHIGARFSSLDDWIEGATHKTLDLFTFTAGASRIVVLKLYCMTAFNFITNPRISLINTAVKLPASGSGEKVFMLGKRIGDTLNDGEIVDNATAQNTGHMHLLQYTVGVDSSHDGSGNHHRHGMFILKEDRLTFRQSNTAVGGNNLRDINITAEIWGLPV